MTKEPAAPPVPTADCSCQPSITSRPLPPCWLRTANARDRLELAAATLRHYSVATVARYDVEPDVGRERILEVLRARFPAGMHSYVFWTATDDSNAFRTDGTLASVLTLYHSPDVTEAVQTALNDSGLSHRPGQQPQTMILATSP